MVFKDAVHPYGIDVNIFFIDVNTQIWEIVGSAICEYGFCRFMALIPVIPKWWFDLTLSVSQCSSTGAVEYVFARGMTASEAGLRIFKGSRWEELG